MTTETAWRFAGVAAMWAGALMIAAPVIFVVALLLQGTSDDGLSAQWFSVSLGSSVATLVLGWLVLRRGALPSTRLGLAERAGGPHRAADRSEWRRWQLVCVAFAVLGGSAMFLFLLALLGRGGLVEGAVVGIVGAVGLATWNDSRRIREQEVDEGRRYLSVGRSPTGAARRLVWVDHPGE